MYIYPHTISYIYIYITLFLIFSLIICSYAMPSRILVQHQITPHLKGLAAALEIETVKRGAKVRLWWSSCFECFVRVIYLGVTLGVKHGKTIHWNVSRSSRLGCASAKDANDLNVISGSPTPSVAMSRSSTAVHQTATSNAWLLRSFPKETLERRCLTKFDSQTEECQRF